MRQDFDLSFYFYSEGTSEFHSAVHCTRYFTSLQVFFVKKHKTDVSSDAFSLYGQNNVRQQQSF